MFATFEENNNIPACFLNVAVTSSDKSSTKLFDINDQIGIYIEYILHEKMSGVNVALVLSREGVPIFTSYDIDVDLHLFKVREAGRYKAYIQLPIHLLKAGIYTVLIALGRSNVGLIDQKIDALVFEISDNSEDVSHKSYAASRAGVLALSLPWNTEKM